MNQGQVTRQVYSDLIPIDCLIWVLEGEMQRDQLQDITWAAFQLIEDLRTLDTFRTSSPANKYLTGFDQPKLTAMYVDKKLQSVLAVQALSRLNRSAPRLGKKTEDLFVLDFFNNTEDIKKSFDPFYTSTSLSQATDINILRALCRCSKSCACSW